jgi:hypothetical protein
MLLPKPKLCFMIRLNYGRATKRNPSNSILAPAAASASLAVGAFFSATGLILAVSPDDASRH